MVKLIEEEAMVSNQEIMSSDYTSGQTLNNWFTAFILDFRQTTFQTLRNKHGYT